MDHLNSLGCDVPRDYVLLDAATQSNTELVELRSARDISLLAVLDRTAFGANRAKEQGDVELLAQRLQTEIREMPALAEKLTKALVDDPPLALKEFVKQKAGYDMDLDGLRNGSREGKDWISQLQE